jgi:predicted permease
MSWISGARTRLQLLFGRRAAESRINEELGFHLDMETNRLIREQGLLPEEARRRARATFGGVTQHTETLKEGRGLAWLSGFSLDMRVGSRMLAKYPGITVIGGIAMAFAIWFGAVVFEMGGQFIHPRIPLPGGDRLVKMENWDVQRSQAEPRAVYDFLLWRDQLKTVTNLSAYRDVPRNLTSPGGEIREIRVAEMTASGFTVSATKPLMGRTFNSNDERGEAPPVVVIAYEVWRDRFGSDPAILGKSVKLGEAFAPIIGVMPERYGFPMAHEAWMPLKLDRLQRTPRAGVPINVFGRLADGASLEDTQKELDLIGQRLAVEYKSTHEHLKPIVAEYAMPFMPSADTAVTVAMNVGIIALLTLICGNIALLLFARAATRETELTVRSALGASRGRIVMQLFAEALVLGGVAAAVGIGAAALTLRIYGMEYLRVGVGTTLPFWIDTDLSPLTVLYALGLTVLAAVIVGVLPALKVTRGISARLRQGTAGSGLRFSGVWTFVIVAQVAATVVLPAIIMLENNEMSRVRTADMGIPAKEYLGMRVDMDAPLIGDVSDAERNAIETRLGQVRETLRQRVASEPGVRGVTFTSDLPGTPHGGARIFLADSAQLPPGKRVVGLAYVDVNYFSVLEAPVLSGRAFHSGDLTEGARNVIVDVRFSEQVLGGGNPIGRRMRIGRSDSTWWEIVGVVKELGMSSPIERNISPGVYIPMRPGFLASPYMLIHASGDLLGMSPRLRTIAEAVDPGMRLNEVVRMDLAADDLVWFLKLWRQITGVLTGIAVILSLAGIYAVLSYTVSKRTREIGVRVAVGASPKRIIATIFQRPLTQVSAGIVVGAILVGLGSVMVRNHIPDSAIGMQTFKGGMPLDQLAVLILYAGAMLGVCLLACIVPTRRALSVQPTEALRAE